MSTASIDTYGLEKTVPLNEAERGLWFAWKRAHETIRARVAKDVRAATGLSDADVTILIHVADADAHADDSRRQNALTARLGWDRARVPHQFSRMEARGLVQRRKVDDGVEVQLTTTGQGIVDVVKPIHAAAVRQHLIDPFNPEQLAHLREALDRIAKPGVGPV